MMYISVAIKQLNLAEILRYGVAAAQGSLVREGTLLCTRKGFEEFVEVVNVKEITSLG